MVCAVLSVCLTASGQVTRGPYIQNVTPDSVSIRWRTSTFQDSVVRYGTSVTSPAALPNQVANSSILRIHAQAVDNAPTFTTSAANISGRTTTTTFATWKPGPWTSVGATETTGNILGPVLEEIVSRGGWSSGQAIVLIISGSGERVADARDNGASGAPMLKVTYSVGGSQTTLPAIPVAANSDDAEEHLVDQSVTLNSSALDLTTDSQSGGSTTFFQLVGLRFASVAIPKNATIVSAEIEFTVNEVGATANDHEVFIDGLNADTKYFYSVGNLTTEFVGNDSDHFFRTAPAVGNAKNTRVWILGDAGRGGQGVPEDAEEVREGFYTWNNANGGTPKEHADLLLMLGDNAYRNGTDQEYQDGLFDIFPNTLRNTGMWLTIGNHEFSVFGGGAPPNFVDSVLETGPYYDFFTLPAFPDANDLNGGSASGSEAYYSFNYGNIHFICLESESIAREPTLFANMKSWLEDDMLTMQEWIIVFFHHPPYSKGTHNTDDAVAEPQTFLMREQILQILEDGGADLVLSGHSHVYERSVLLKGHYDVSSTLTPAMQLDTGDGQESGDGPYEKINTDDGTVYTVAGSSSRITGGSASYSFFPPHNNPTHPVMVESIYDYGSVVLDVNNKRLDAYFINKAGAVLDSYTVLKENLAPTVDAGGNDSATLSGASVNVNLNGTVTDDGIPDPPGSFTVLWTQESGPAGGVSFGPNNTVDTTATFTQTGTYVLKLEADDSDLKGSDTVSITINPPGNVAPNVNAGADDSATLSGASVDVNLDGTVTDDGLPNPPGSFTVLWTQESGPAGGVSFGPNNTVDTTATFTQTGTYVLKLEANDSALSGSDTVSITIHSSGGSSRVTTGLVALYTFMNGSGSTVSDVSNVSPALNLAIQTPGNVSWVAGGGLTLSSPGSVILSSGNGGKVVSEPMQNNGLSVEFWIQPSAASQSGAPRVFTISANDTTRDVAMVYSGNKLQSRIRRSGSTSGQPYFTSSSGFFSTALIHVVVTRNAAGRETIYKNGVAKHGRTQAGDLSNWVQYALALAGEVNGTRRWLGTYYLAAIYSRALTPTEVVQNFNAGHQPTGGNPVNAAPNVNAGADDSATLSGASVDVNLDGTVTDDGLPNPPGSFTVLWTQESGPAGGVSFGPNNTVDTTATFTQTGTYVLKLEADDSDLKGSDTVSITINPPGNVAPNVNAGADDSATLSGASVDVNLDGTVTDDGLPNPPGSFTVLWTQESGPAGGVSFGPNNTVDTTATFTQTGTYVLKLEANDSALSGSDTVSITIHSSGGSSRVTTGLVALYTFMNGSGSTVSDVSNVSPALNLAIQTPGNVSWVAGGGLTLSSPGSVILSSGNGGKVVSEPMQNNGLSVEFWIQPSAASQSGAPRVFTISANDTTRDVAMVYSGNKLQSRIRRSGSTSGQPYFTSSSGFFSTALIHVVVTRNAAGRETIYKNGVAKHGRTQAGDLSNWVQYALALAGEVNGTRRWLGTYYLAAIYSRALTPTEVVQNFNAGHQPTGGNPVNAAPNVNAGADDSATLSGASVDVNLDGTVTDDGLPNPPGSFTVLWTQESGPAGGVSFGPNNTVDTTATFTQTGTYVLKLEADDSDLKGSDTVSITINPPGNVAPNVNAGADDSATLSGASVDVNLDGTVTDDGLPNPPGSFTVLWTQESGPAGGVSFGPNNTVDTTATFTQTGTYVLKLEANDSALSGSDTVSITIHSSGGSSRVTTGLVALYTFMNGSGSTVSDVSNVSPALNLAIQTPGNVSWVAGGGLTLSSPGSVILSSGNGGKVVSEPMQNNGLSVEFWIQPSAASQSGAPRVFTISANDTTRDVAMVYSGNKLQSRIRRSGSTSGQPYFTSSSGFFSTALIHVVVTRNAAGRETIYKNGVAKHGRTQAGDLSNWVQYALALAGEVNGTRRWLGTYYLAAIYSRALTPTEVVQNFNAGHQPSSGGGSEILVEFDLVQSNESLGSDLGKQGHALTYIE